VAILKIVSVQLKTALNAIPQDRKPTVQLQIILFLSLGHLMQNLCPMITLCIQVTWLIQNHQGLKLDHKVHQNKGQIHLKSNQAAEEFRSREEMYLDQ
jgi:hypothetical protein